MRNKLSFFVLSVIGIMFFAGQGLAGYLNLATEPKAAEMQASGLQDEGVAQVKLDVIARNASDLGVLATELSRIAPQSLSHEVVPSESKPGEEIYVNVSPVDSPERKTAVLYVIREGKVAQVVVGVDQIAAYRSPKGPEGPARAQFGADHYQDAARIKGLLGDAATRGVDTAFMANVKPTEYGAVKTALEALLSANPSLGVALAGVALPDALKSVLNDLPLLSDINAILTQARVVEDPQLTVNFYIDESGNSIPVFGKAFLEFLLARGRADAVAQVLMHEDREPAIAAVLKANEGALRAAGITGDLDEVAHDVVTAIQTQSKTAGVRLSLVGRTNELYDLLLLYQKEQGVLQGQDLADANTIEVALRQDSAVSAEIDAVAQAGASEPVGSAVQVNEAGEVAIAGKTLSGSLADAIKGWALTGRTFSRTVDRTFSSIARFLVRVGILSKSAASKALTIEGRISDLSKVRKGQPLPDAPKAVVIDVDAVANVDISRFAKEDGSLDESKIYNADGSVNENAVVTLSQVTVGMSRAIASQIAKVQAQGGNVKIVLASKKLPQWFLDSVAQQMDAVSKEGVPVTISFKDTNDLLAKLSEKFAGKALTEDDILFYLTAQNVAEYRADPNFARFYKVLEVARPSPDDRDNRVSAAMLMVAVDLVYAKKDEFKDTLLALFREVLDELKRAGEITDEEYQALLPKEDTSTGFFLIPPVKADSMTQQIEDSLRTTVAAAKFA